MNEVRLFSDFPTVAQDFGQVSPLCYSQTGDIASSATALRSVGLQGFGRGVDDISGLLFCSGRRTPMCRSAKAYKACQGVLRTTFTLLLSCGWYCMKAFELHLNFEKGHFLV